MTGPDRSPEEPARGRRSRSTRAVWLGAAVIVFAAASIAAFAQPSRPDPFRAVSRLSLDWWIHPLEVNAFRRLPAINATLNAVASVPGTRSVWAVGDGGAILASDDDGHSWKQVVLDRTKLSQPPKAATAPFGDAEPRAGLGVVSEAYAEEPVKNRAQRPIGAQQQTAPREEPPPLLPVPEPDDAAKKAPPSPPRSPSILPGMGPDEAAKARDAARRAAPTPRTPVAPRPTPPPPVQPTPTPPAPQYPRFDATGRLNVQLRSVVFVDTRHGWIAGAGTVLATDDGGETWTDRPLGDPSLSVTGLSFVDAQRGWLLAVAATSARSLILTTRDGGRTWQRQLEPEAFLSAIRFSADGQKGWAVGFVGSAATIYWTENGGASWAPAAVAPQERESQQSLLAVEAVPNSQTVWAVGLRTMLVSRDGGRSWTKGRDVDGALSSVRFASDGRRGWAAGNGPAGALVLVTQDGGQQWSEAAPPCDRPRALAFTAQGGVRIAGEGGAVLSSHDQGRTWRSEMAGGAANFKALHFSRDGYRGVAIGRCGTILTTRDSGGTWATVSSGPRAPLQALAFEPDDVRGWIGVADGTLLTTSNGGETWTVVRGFGRPLASEVAAAANGRVWAAGRDRIFASDDAGRSWKAVETPGLILAVAATRTGVAGLALGGTIYRSEAGNRSIFAAHPELKTALRLRFLPDGVTGWIVGAAGLIARTGDGGQTWEVRDSRARDDLFDADFASPNVGWAVGARGTVLATSDAGSTWRSVAKKPAELTLRSVRGVGDRSVWVAGDAGALFFTEDAGASWRTPGHRWYPAPWYYLTWIVVGLLLIPAARRPEDVVAPERDVADVLVSDRPLMPGDRDVLALDGVAEGLSRFLRNTNTRPPLTIAITGPWGSGKSSLMNLLRAKLEGAGFRPVWFNAWHHQKEEHLLASLLENVRRQAIPPWWHPDGFGFRTRLLLDRAEGRWVQLIVLALAVGSSAGYLAANWTDISVRFASLTAGARDGSWFTALGDFVKKIPETSNAWDLVVSLIGGGGAIKLAQGARNAFKAFGVSPASLLALKSGDASTKGLEEMAGFRHRFAREFGEVTRSLSPRDMVIIIDDLDRCRPANVLEVLEAVNFLVSSGDCFVVLGMEPDRVLRSIGLGHKEVADELLDEEVAKASATTVPGSARAVDPEEAERMRRQRRQAFARLYLEKLINIEIRIPALTPEAAARLMTAEVERPAPAFGRTILAQAQALGRRVALPVTLGALIVGSGWWAATHFGPVPPQALVTDGASSETTGGAGRPVGPPSVVVEPNPTSPGPLDQALGLLNQPQSANPPGAIAYVPLLALLLAGAWIVWRRAANVVVSDSPEFAAALAAWTPLVHRHGATPRGMKRFLNRVRYYAMRQRPLEPAPSTVARILGFWRRIEEAQAAASAPPAPQTPADPVTARGESGRIPEWALVGLAAVEHVHPEWLSDARLFDDPLQFLKSTESAEMLPDDIVANLPRYVQWQPSQRASFLSLSTGVRM